MGWLQYTAPHCYKALILLNAHFYRIIIDDEQLLRGEMVCTLWVVVAEALCVNRAAADRPTVAAPDAWHAPDHHGSRLGPSVCDGHRVDADARPSRRLPGQPILAAARH